MRKMFAAEANKYQVFPLDASVAARIEAAMRNNKMSEYKVRQL